MEDIMTTSALASVEIIADRLPWERQDGESEQAYRAFLAFRDAGSGRTVTGVGTQLARSRQLCDRWAQRWVWRARVEAFDAAQDRQRRAVLLEEQRQIVARHSAAAQRLLDGA